MTSPRSYLATQLTFWWGTAKLFRTYSSRRSCRRFVIPQHFSLWTQSLSSHLNENALYCFRCLNTGSLTVGWFGRFRQCGFVGRSMSVISGFVSLKTLLHFHFGATLVCAGVWRCEYSASWSEYHLCLLLWLSDIVESFPPGALGSNKPFYIRYLCHCVL